MALVRYSLIRLALLLVAAAILYLVGLRGEVVLALVVEVAVGDDRLAALYKALDFIGEVSAQVQGQQAPGRPARLPENGPSAFLWLADC